MGQISIFMPPENGWKADLELTIFVN